MFLVVTCVIGTTACGGAEVLGQYQAAGIRGGGRGYVGYRRGYRIGAYDVRPGYVRCRTHEADHFIFLRRYTHYQQ